jgi:hypothetical protein
VRVALLCVLSLLTAAVAYGAEGPRFEVASVKVADPNLRLPASSMSGTGRARH